MTRNIKIEAGLDQALAKQIPVPRLDTRFNAAVWVRIAEQEAPAIAPRARDSRWLFASNLLGIGVSVALVLYFVAQAISGFSVDVELTLPEISEHTNAAITQGMVWAVTVVSVGFGLGFTRVGRRMLDLCRSEFT